jgi:hypothetical protein
MTTSVLSSHRSAADHARPTTARPVPTWVRRLAHLTPLTVLPSGLWRLPLAFGFSMGMPQSWMDLLDAPGWGSVYVVSLTVLAEALALLTLGLVQPWGERVPRWMPLLGGRRVPVYAAVVPASLGAVSLMVLWTPILWEWTSSGLVGPGVEPGGAWNAVLFAAYVPLVLWGPLLAVVTAAYWWRRRQERVVVR